VIRVDKWRSRMQGLMDKVDSLLAEDGQGFPTEVEEETLVVQAVEKARRELQSARSYFENVSEPDMVDHAVYSLQAAEKKYTYLLKYARKKGYRQPFAWGYPLHKEEG
jgi:hypothetical protein